MTSTFCRGFADIWRGVIWPRLVKWWGRISGLPKQMEALEVGVILAGAVMASWLASCPPAHTESRAADALFALCPRRVWVGVLWVCVGVGAGGFLEEVSWMRRWATGAAALFWWLTGVFLWRHLPHLFLPRLMLLVGFLASTVWTFVAESRIKWVYRHAPRPPGRFWWLTGLHRH